MPFDGSAAVQPQFAPPCAPGIDTVSFSAGGVNRPSLRAFAIRVFHVSRSSGVRMYGLMSSAVSRCGANGGGAVGNGWVGHAASPGISLGRNAALFDGPHRLARHAIEDVQEAGFSGLGHDVDRSSVAPDGRELRGGDVVVVPQIVVHHLEVPQPLPRARVQCQQRRAEQIGAMTIGAVEVVGR